MICRQLLVAALLLGSLLAPAYGQSSSAANQTEAPVNIPYEEVWSHRVGPRLILRAQLDPDLSSLLAIDGIAVDVEVGPDGAVRSAKARPDIAVDPPHTVPGALLFQAEAVIRGTRYKLFERDGRAVSAIFEDNVEVLPPELKPEHHVSFPEIKNWDSVVLKLRRTGCLGSCPSYEVEVLGDGTVHYKGRSFVAILGDHSCSVPQETCESSSSYSEKRTITRSEMSMLPR